MLLLSEIVDRNNFGKLFTQLGYRQGVEVGTHRGVFAERVLDQWRGHLHCVDPWKNLGPGYDDQAHCLIHALEGSTDRSQDLDTAVRHLAKFRGRVTFHQKTSLEAARTFQLESVDWVYVDGDHREEFVFADLCAWWPIIKPGGILAGHDFICPGEENDGWGRGTQSAVETFYSDFKLDADVYLVTEPKNLPWSFYMIKP